VKIGDEASIRIPLVPDKPAQVRGHRPLMDTMPRLARLTYTGKSTVTAKRSGTCVSGKGRASEYAATSARPNSMPSIRSP
jgi:hypothetical protein